MEITLSETDKQILARHSPGVRGRALIELQIVDALIKAAVGAGYHFEIEDADEGDGDPADAAQLKAALFNRDDAVLLVFNGKGRKAFGWIRLVFGNDGWDLVSGYSVSLEEFLRPVNAVADFWGQ